MSKLILARHGQTPYNEAGVWTGLTDVGLTERGSREATKAGLLLADIAINAAYYSMLKRTRATLCGMLMVHGNSKGVYLEANAALNERDYGVFTGKNKARVREEYGPGVFQKIRRAWDYPIEGGQSLRDVHAVVAPFHHELVVPRLVAGENVLVISSNNPLRAYVKELEGLSTPEVESLELGTAEVRIYDFDSAMHVAGKVVHRIGEVH